MDTNVGATDSRIRWALAIVLFAVALAYNASPIIALVSALLALVLAGTAVTRVCPIWHLLHRNTLHRAVHQRDLPAHH